jgi:outer membrane protein OmpA-like peptidoglycan-associated protein
MRALPILSAVFVTAAAPVFAQVTVDLHALEALPERPAAGPTRPRPQVVPNGPTVVTRVAPIARAPAAIPAPQPQPALPEAEPQTASINPIAPPEPPAGSAPPPPPPVSATAATKAAPTTAGLRLTFAPEQSDLSPDSSASIKQLATSTPPGDDTTYNVQAYAPGKPDDPSTARRVSLSRAMAVRAALVASGVPSARIFVRALGEQFGDGPPDRVDIAVNGAPGTAAAK